MRARIMLATTALLAAGALYPAFGQTQKNPDADQIVKSLTPGPGMSPATRGIRIGTPQGGPATQAQPVSQSQPQVQAQRQDQAPSANLTVEFHSGSATLTPAAMHALDELGRALSDPRLAAFRFRIEGHTDTVGSREMNQSLSEQRAATVVGYLTTRGKVSADRLQPIGMGEEGLLIATPDQTAEPRNRRVLVVNVGS